MELQKTENGYKQSLLVTCFHAAFLFGLLFDPEDGDDMLLRNFD
jgi:hypothetical protein